MNGACDKPLSGFQSEFIPTEKLFGTIPPREPDQVRKHEDFLKTIPMQQRDELIYWGASWSKTGWMNR